MLPFLAALGYDVFDPFVVRMDSTGSNTDTDLKHPDARVEYSIRRNGVPAILIACHAVDDETAVASAKLRVEQCLAQSPALLGTATDGRTWHWAVCERKHGERARWFHRTEATDEQADDIRVAAAYSAQGWDPDDARCGWR